MFHHVGEVTASRTNTRVGLSSPFGLNKTHGQASTVVTRNTRSLNSASRNGHPQISVADDQFAVLVVSIGLQGLAALTPFCLVSSCPMFGIASFCFLFSSAEYA